MKICIVGHFSDRRDEGVRIVGKQIASLLEKDGQEVHRIEISSLSQLTGMRKISPDIVHIVLSPTTPGIMVSKAVSIINYRAKFILSAVQPSVSGGKLLRLFKPDLTLVQSEASQRTFDSLGYPTQYFINCIDIDRFSPCSQSDRVELRKKYDLPLNSFVLLHLASLTRERNLEIFKDLAKNGNNTVLIIGRENEHSDPELVKELREAGCLVWIKHLDKIEDIYHLSDCYVFPTIEPKACIETPLSVLEAMSCNLPVITTRFGALSRVFNEKDGLSFVNDVNEIPVTIERVKLSNGVKTRAMVLPYSNAEMSRRLIDIYKKVISNGRV